MKFLDADFFEALDPKVKLAENITLQEKIPAQITDSGKICHN